MISLVNSHVTTSGFLVKRDIKLCISKLFVVLSYHTETHLSSFVINDTPIFTLVFLGVLLQLENSSSLYNFIVLIYLQALQVIYPRLSLC